MFDIEPETIKDEITGKERIMLNVENKVEDVTQALLTMARGSTRSKEVNELTKQIISESVAEEYASLGITNNINSLYVAKKQGFDLDFLGNKKRQCQQLVLGIIDYLRKHKKIKIQITDFIIAI